MKTFKLHLIRHGLTQGNLDGIYVGGGLDVPLCPPGEEQLQQLKTRFRYPAAGLLFSSPMRRALQTADILYPHLSNRIILEELRENRFGEFEGKRVEEVMENEHFRSWLNPTSNFVPQGGESGRDFAARCAQALRAMLEHQMRNNITAAACITHGGVIMAMLAQMALPQKPPQEWMSANGCGFTVRSSASLLMRDNLVEAIAIIPEGFMESQGLPGRVQEE